MTRAPNLNALRMFDAAARHLTFREAAEEVALTQGAVAQQVRGLEADLGVQLFERRARGLTLTDAGRAYHRSVAKGLAIINEATARVAVAPARVTLSVPPSLAAKWLVPRLGDFAAAHPDVDLATIASETVSDFARDGVDIAIRQGHAVSRAGEVVTPLAKLDLVAVAGGERATRLAKAAGPADLTGEPLIQDGHARWTEVGVADGRALQFNQTALAIDAAAAGQGVAIAPRILVAAQLAAGELTELFPVAGPAGEGFFLAAPAKPRAPGAMQVVADWLMQAFGASPDPEA